VTGDGQDELLIGSPAGDAGLDGLVLVCSLTDLQVLGALFPWQHGQDPDERHPDFGRALRVDDFNHDGWLDVAIGDPTADAGAVARAGAVWYFPGPLDARFVSRLTAETPTEDARFGSTLTSGDFDGDGWPDLAIAAPGDSDSGDGSGGASVTVLYGPDFARCQTREAGDGGNPFGVALAALPAPADSGAPVQQLLAGAPEAWDGARAAGGAFAWSGDDAPIRLAPSNPSDARFGAAVELGDFSARGDVELAVLAPQNAGAIYLYDAVTLATTQRIALPADFAGRAGAPLKLLPDVSRDHADELVLLSADRDEDAGIIFSPGHGAAHLRLDFAASDALIADFDGDGVDEVLLATPTSFKPTGGYSLLRIVDFSWQKTVSSQAKTRPIAIPGSQSQLAPFTSR
jgi:hypothetical protein